MEINSKYAISYLIKMIANIKIKDNYQAKENFLQFLKYNPQLHFRDELLPLLPLEKVMNSMKNVFNMINDVEILFEIASLYQILL